MNTIRISEDYDPAHACLSLVERYAPKLLSVTRLTNTGGDKKQPLLKKNPRSSASLYRQIIRERKLAAQSQFPAGNNSQRPSLTGVRSGSSVSA